MATRDQLQAAIAAGEVVKIVYHGGSQPGTMREIGPISISGNKVRARCYTSKMLKTFVLDKIEFVDDEERANTVPDWSSEVSVSPHFETVEALVAEAEINLTTLGWHVEHDSDWISLHRRFKNGKPHKGSDVSLEYDEMTSDLVLGEDGDFHEENVRPRQKPWTVRGKRQTTRAFKRLDHAAEQFLNWATLLAPGLNR